MTDTTTTLTPAQMRQKAETAPTKKTAEAWLERARQAEKAEKTAAKARAEAAYKPTPRGPNAPNTDGSMRRAMHAATFATMDDEARADAEAFLTGSPSVAGLSEREQKMLEGTGIDPPKYLETKAAIAARSPKARPKGVRS